MHSRRPRPTRAPFRRPRRRRPLGAAPPRIAPPDAAATSGS